MNELSILSKETWVTKGATRSLIVNGKNGQFMFIPNNIAEILSKNNFSKEEFGEDFEFFDYFLSEDYICNVSSSIHYQFISKKNEETKIEKTFIIDIDEKSNLELLCGRLLEANYKFEYIQIRVFNKLERINLNKILTVVNQIVTNGFELAVNFEIDSDEFLKTYQKLYYIQIFKKETENIKIEGLKVVECINEEMVDESSCGNVCNRNFIFNSDFKLKSSNGNTCLKNKFSIDRFGNYKNCPSMKNSFGELKNGSIKSAIMNFYNSNDKLLTEITKDQIEDCKICEFRDVCMDCRAFRIEENIYSKPSKCNYEPSKGIWNIVSILILLFLSHTTFSQNRYYVIDSSDFSPIPFSKVIHSEKKSVIYSNEFGFLETDNQFKKDDTIRIIAYGYKIKDILISDVENDTFFLSPIEKITSIEEVVIRPIKWTDFILNDFEKPHFGNLSLQNGGIISSYIDKSKFAKGKLERIDVYIKSLDSNYNLKLILFNYDIVRNCPREKINISDVFIDFNGTPGWYSIKLNDTIYMPKDGICIGFETIPKNNKMIFDKNQCNNSSVIFSSFYEKLENGNRTSFTSLQSNKWYTPEANDIKVENVLNLAVRLHINGNLDLPKNEIPKFISNRKVNRKLNYKPSNIELKNSTMEDLFKSIIKCINQNNLVAISQLIVINKENKNQFNDFVNKNNENWLTENEKSKALIEWNYYLENIDIAQIVYISQEYIEIIFPNKNNLFLKREISGWKISPYYNKIVQ